MDGFEGTVTVERVLSQLEGGCIFSGRREDGTALRVCFTGRDTQPLPGDSFVVQGLLHSHQDRFGRAVAQVDSKCMTRTVTAGALLGPWLKQLPNVGPKRSGRLVQAFGHSLPDVLADTSRIADVAAALEPSKSALAARIAAQLYAAVALAAGTEQLRAAELAFLAYLERLGIANTRLARHLWRLMAGLDAVERLRRNPYVTASLMDWRMADVAGKRLLREVSPAVPVASHPARLLGAVNSVWRDVLADGDTASTYDDLVEALEARNVPVQAALTLAEERGLLRRQGDLLRAPGAAWLEDQVALALWAMENHTATLEVPTGDALEKLVRVAEHATELRLTLEQREAVITLLGRPVAVLQGGAGVGKTTVMKVLARAWEQVGGEVVLGALAGKAALTLSRGASTAQSPRLAYTVARLIGMLERQHAQVADPEFRRLQSDIIFTERTLLVVDEAGMLDTSSLYKLLKLLPQGARLLLSGDAGQLPPVDIGKVFHDLVEEGSRVSTLTKVLRQADDSQIPRVAALVRNGQVPALALWTGEAKGVYLLPESELETARCMLRAGGALMELAAKRATVAAINEAQAHRAHTASAPVRRLGPLATVAVGDPVVMTVNRYQDGLFNGLLGVVAGIDDEEVLVHWDGEPVPRGVPTEAEGYIELAYAITCHKAQGSSEDRVLIVVEDTPLVTREWLYTGITRGKELVLLVASDALLANAVIKRTNRITGFVVPKRIG
jgi:exodeoxyribonuclease V alpha subunit